MWTIFIKERLCSASVLQTSSKISENTMNLR